MNPLKPSAEGAAVFRNFPLKTANVHKCLLASRSCITIVNRAKNSAYERNVFHFKLLRSVLDSIDSERLIKGSATMQPV